MNQKAQQPSAQDKAVPPLKFIQAARAFETVEIDRVRKNAKIAWRISAACLLLTGSAVGAPILLPP